MTNSTIIKTTSRRLFWNSRSTKRPLKVQTMTRSLNRLWT